MSHIRGPRLNYRLKYWLCTGRLSVRPFIGLDEVSWGQPRVLAELGIHMGRETADKAALLSSVITHSTPCCDGTDLDTRTAIVCPSPQQVRSCLCWSSLFGGLRAVAPRPRRRTAPGCRL